jgi:hypothetical protein
LLKFAIVFNALNFKSYAPLKISYLGEIMQGYLDESGKLKLVVNLAAFFYLAELWLVNLQYVVGFSPLVHWITDLVPVELMVYEWAWHITLDQVIFGLSGALLWILPYRLLSFLKPLKVIPYLWIVTFGFIAFQFFLKNMYHDNLEQLNLDRYQIGHIASYLLPAALFHYYFREKASEPVAGAKEPRIWAAK